MKRILVVAMLVAASSFVFTLKKGGDWDAK